MAVSAYATRDDLALYLADVSTTQNQAIWDTLLSMASRFIDAQTGQYFYPDGQYARFFDGEGTAHIDTGMHPFWGKSGTIASCGKGATSLSYTPTVAASVIPAINDVFTLDVASVQETVTVSAVSGTGPYTLTVGATAFAHATSTLATTFQIQLAYFENQPIAQWVSNLSGDGVSPGTNFFLWPRNRPSAGSSTLTNANRPFYGMDIARIPVSSTLYLPSSIPGYFTVSINAHWGWPAVPDTIKDLTCKLAARAWRAREAGWSEVLASSEIGVVHMHRWFDTMDEMILTSSDYVLTYL